MTMEKSRFEQLMRGVQTGSEGARRELIEIYGTGFGPTNPSIPTAQLVSQPAPLTVPATVSVGGMNATVQWAGLVSSGLYQLNVTVPMVAAGDQTVQATVSGFQSPATVMLSIAAQ